MSIPFRFPDDVARIVAALAYAGIDASLEEAHDAWTYYSDSMCAGWMMLPKTDAMLAAIAVTALRELEESEALKRLRKPAKHGPVGPEDILAQRWLSQAGAK